MPYGPDLSNNNGRVDYPTLFGKAKPDFLIAKASEGAWFRDGYFIAHRRACRLARVPFGAYHFARPDRGTNPKAEAAYFANVLGKIEDTDLRPALDIEVGNPNRTWAVAFCNELERLCGVQPLLYSYVSYVQGIGGWHAADLWLANLVSPGKAVLGCALHQYTFRHATPGAGTTDYNYAAGLDNLLAFPPKRLSNVQLRYLWARWRLGEGEFKAFGKANPAHRPVELPTQIPASWWAWLIGFLAARRVKA